MRTRCGLSLDLRMGWLKRAVYLLVMGWTTVFVYEAVRQVIHLGEYGEYDESLARKAQPEFHEEHTFLRGDDQDFFRFSKFDCANVSRPTKKFSRILNVWYLYQQLPKYEIFVYSVYYDDRMENGILPSLRILNVGRTIKDPDKLYCQVWFPGFPKPYVVQAIITKNGAGHGINKTHYEQYYFTCDLPTSYPIPSHVSLTSMACEQPSSYIPVHVPIRTPPLHDFGVCVPISFKHVNPYLLVEWLEACRIFGVTEVNVYHNHMSNESLQVLRHYEKNGFVRLWPIPSVPKYEDTRGGNKIGSPISLNDCMYRNTYRYRWAVVIDFDEVIVPRLDQNYTAMLARVDKEEKLEESPPAYTFRNTYFWTGCDDANSAPIKKLILTTKNRQKPSHFLYAAKSMIDPRRCISVFNHYCYHRFPSKRKIRWTIDVKETTALSHHYRQVYHGRKKKPQCEQLKNVTFPDDIISKYSEKLAKLYNNAVNEVGL